MRISTDNPRGQISQYSEVLYDLKLTARTSVRLFELPTSIVLLIAGSTLHIDSKPEPLRAA